MDLIALILALTPYSWFVYNLRGARKVCSSLFITFSVNNNVTHDSYETSERDQRDLIFGWTHRESIRSLSLNRSKSKGLRCNLLASHTKTGFRSKSVDLETQLTKNFFRLPVHFVLIVFIKYTLVQKIVKI